MFFFFKQKTAYEMRISDWSSDVCSSELADLAEWLEEETLETAVAVGDREGILAWIERIAIDEPSHENRRMMCEFVATVGCNPIIAEINRKADVRLRTSLGAALASLAPGASPQDRST